MRRDRLSQFSSGSAFRRNKVSRIILVQICDSPRLLLIGPYLSSRPISLGYIEARSRLLDAEIRSVVESIITLTKCQ